MQAYDLKKSNPVSSNRVDISTININTSIPVTARAEQYLTQIKNPYFFKYGEIAVNVVFSIQGKTLKKALISCSK